jgi:signal transduction histidine kinase
MFSDVKNARQLSTVPSCVALLTFRSPANNINTRSPLLPENLRSDIEAVGRIDAVPSILEVVCRTTGMGFAAVARVTEDRWIACSVRDEIQFGLQPGGELQVETTLCNEIRESGEEIVIDDVPNDAEYCNHHTPARYGFRSYISMPIRLKDGSFFGTLCAIDPKPARLKTPETVGMFKLFADLIAFHLESQQRLASTEATLFDERRTAELREQFIAVLGHDLRNPLASIKGGADLLRKTPLTEKATEILGLVQSSADRMARLIDNVLDFARGRLGGGLSLDRDDASLQPLLEQVINELRAAHPDREIQLNTRLSEPVSSDRGRLAQLVSNLVSNALTHGAPDSPVVVDAISEGGSFELTIANRGEPIPPALLGSLFEPFFRASTRPTREGLGLGLYIANEIARSHGGKLSATSTPQETRFTLRMPSR